MVFEIAALQLFPQFAQGQAEIKTAADVDFRFFFRFVQAEFACDGGFVDFLFTRRQCQGFDDIVQLVEVARPVVSGQEFQRAIAETGDGDFLGFRQFGGDTVNQEGNVAGLFAQRRDLELEAGEQGKQFGVVGRILQPFVRGTAAGADNPNILFFGFAEQEVDALLDVFAVLRDVAEEEDAAGGFLQQFHLHIDDVFGFGRFDPRGIVFMEIVGNEFERRSGFAAEQDGVVLFDGGFDTEVELLNGGAVAQFVQRQPGRSLLFAVFQSTFYGAQQFFQCDWLFEEIHGADFGRFDGGVYAGMTAHHDDGHGQLAVFRPFFKQGDAVAVGHPDVEQHHGRTGLVAQLACFFGVFRQADGVTFVLQDVGQQVADTDFVVYD